MEFAELAERILMMRAAQVLFVETQIHEVLRVLAEHFCGGQGGMDLRVFRVEVASVFVVPQSDHAVLVRAGAVEPPLRVGDRLRELALHRGFGI